MTAHISVIAEWSVSMGLLWLPVRQYMRWAERASHAAPRGAR